jgi:hypothetical protein
MKWFRKNNMKVMAVVIIIILFGFIGGEFLRQLGQRTAGLHKTIAYFGENKKITNNDRVLAQQELGTLKALGADMLLKNVSILLFRQQDLRTFLLSELLFSERRISPQLINQIKQSIIANKYRISDKQVTDIYSGPVSSDIYWLLLKNEAKQAGFRVSNEEAGKLLGRAIPSLFKGASYSQLIKTVVSQRGVPEKKILAVFGKLLMVVEYAKTMCSTEDITTFQIMHSASWDNEMFDVEFVKLNSSVFADAESEPGEEEMVEHFDRYKKFFAGDISDQNPYGFGYKLPDRAKLEYIVIKLDDISKTAAAPTQQEMEEYFERHSARLTEQVPLDPNDPNSPLIERTMSYGEVASNISKVLLQDKISSKAEQIIRESRALAEAGFEDIDTGNLTAEQFQQAAMAADYKTIAEQLTEKYNVKVYAGQTGLLSAADIQSNEHLIKLYLRGYGYSPTRLYQMVFAIDQLGTSDLGLFDIPKPRMYENIGPLRDISELMRPADTSGRIMALFRVIETQKASEPESINQTYHRDTIKLDLEQDTEIVYSVKDKVAEDLKKLAAMDTTKSKADELIALAAKDGWESAVGKFNELYGQQTKQNESDPDVFMLQNLTNLQRISTAVMKTWAVQSQGNPMAQSIINDGKRERQLRSQFYSLVPQDADTIDNLPTTMEFKPDLSYYCLKDISVKHLDQQQYENIRTLQVYKEDITGAQSLAAIHFAPENILKRMNFRVVSANEETTDANTPISTDKI